MYRNFLSLFCAFLQTVPKYFPDNILHCRGAKGGNGSIYSGFLPSSVARRPDRTRYARAWTPFLRGLYTWYSPGTFRLKSSFRRDCWKHRDRKPVLARQHHFAVLSDFICHTHFVFKRSLNIENRFFFPCFRLAVQVCFRFFKAGRG